MERSHQQQYLDGLQFVRWVRRDPRDCPVEPDLTLDLSPTEGALFELAAVVDQCKACSLHRTRRHTVFGAGSPSADCMFVGEAPGAEEDRRGLPFVGRAGQLLDAMIFALGLERDQTYIANVLKCRPPNNRDPQPDEVASCEPYLQRQIEIVRPRIICCMGRHAAHALLKTEASLSRLRGQLHEYQGIPLIVTYHPAALLRNAGYKRAVWEDVKWVRRLHDGTEL